MTYEMFFELCILIFFENSQGSVEVNAVLKFDTSATVSDSDVQNSVENSATLFDGKQNTKYMHTCETTLSLSAKMFSITYYFRNDV